MTDLSYLDLLPLSTKEMAKFYGGLGNLVTSCCGCHATMYNPDEWKCDGCWNRLSLSHMDWFSTIENEEKIQKEINYYIQLGLVFPSS